MSGPGARRKAQLAKAQKEEEFLSQFTVMKCDMPDEVRRFFPHSGTCTHIGLQVSLYLTSLF